MLSNILEQDIILDWLKKIWDDFITGFCEVDFVCYEGEPNWLGFIFLIPILWGVFLIIVWVIGQVLGFIVYLLQIKYDLYQKVIKFLKKSK